MLRQVTVIKFNDSVTEPDIADVAAGFSAISNLVEGIRRFEFGPDIGIMEGAWDYALVIDFDSEKAWSDYRDHPEHVAFAKQFVPLAADAVRVQYELD